MRVSTDRGRSAKLDLIRQAFELRDRHAGTPAGFVRFSEVRHGAQRRRIAQAAIGADEQLGLLTRFERGAYLPAGAAEPQRCCLFHVIVACEWAPTYAELIQLRQTFDAVAGLLFDATDGMITLGQINVGGPELLACADIQIFASNRLFPRAWVNGMHLDHKYQPIRIGRGYWRKGAGRADPWQMNLGPAVLAHEWLHYALGLKDDYVKVSGGYAVPDSNPGVNTLMANLESSELIGATEWRQLAANPLFQWLIPAGHQPMNIPPDPLPAPGFTILGTAAAHTGGERAIWLSWERAGLSDRLDPERCWAFVLIGAGDDDRTLDAPARLIAQGTCERHPEGYQIIGARANAYLLLVGHAPAAPDVPRVLYSKITGVSGAHPIFWDAGWVDATPEGGPAQQPLVAISTAQTEAPYQVQVQIHDPLRRDWAHTLFALGEPGAAPAATVGALDGHVLLVAQGSEGRYQVAIANFSIGGSPGAAYPASPNPVPAGSSDGNAMIFFYDEEARTIAANSGPADRQHATSALRIITATNLAGPARPGHEPQSYGFAVVSNAPLPVDPQGSPLYYPTLVLYYDTPGEAGGPAVQIHRLGPEGWAPLPAAVQQDFPERLLVAAQLTSATAPGLFAAAPAPEYYRLFRG